MPGWASAARRTDAAQAAPVQPGGGIETPAGRGSEACADIAGSGSGSGSGWKPDQSGTGASAGSWATGSDGSDV